MNDPKRAAETTRLLEFTPLRPLLEDTRALYLEKPTGLLVIKKLLGHAKLEVTCRGQRSVYEHQSCVEAGGYDLPGAVVVDGMACVASSILFDIATKATVDGYRKVYRIQDDAAARNRLRVVPNGTRLP